MSKFADKVSGFVDSHIGKPGFVDNSGEDSARLDTAGAYRQPSATLQVIDRGEGSDPAVFGQVLLPADIAIQGFWNTRGVQGNRERAIISLGPVDITLPGRRMAEAAISRVVIPLARVLGRRAAARGQSQIS